MANTANDLLNEAQKHVGVSGRPNKFTRDYASRHGNDFLAAAWCLMFVCWCARKVGALAAFPKGDRAYTPWYSDDLDDAHVWHTGTTANIKQFAYPGCPVLFDWGGSNVKSNVDHVGIVKKVLPDGRIITIEGNTGGGQGMVALHVRGADVIAGFGTPKFDQPTTMPITNKWPYATGVLMRKGWENSKGVEKVQAAINADGYAPKLITDGDYGTKTYIAVGWYQKKHRLTVDHIVGPATWRSLFPMPS
jgi:hypothetical protein